MSVTGCPRGGPQGHTPACPVLTVCVAGRPGQRLPWPPRCPFPSVPRLHGPQGGRQDTSGGPSSLLGGCRSQSPEGPSDPAKITGVGGGGAPSDSQDGGLPSTRGQSEDRGVSGAFRWDRSVQNCCRLSGLRRVPAGSVGKPGGEAGHVPVVAPPAGLSGRLPLSPPSSPVAAAGRGSLATGHQPAGRHGGPTAGAGLGAPTPVTAWMCAHQVPCVGVWEVRVHCSQCSPILSIHRPRACGRLGVKMGPGGQWRGRRRGSQGLQLGFQAPDSGRSGPQRRSLCVQALITSPTSPPPGRLP